MNLDEFIKQELNPRLKNTAFFIGNGINNYCQTTSSWKNLLNDLAKTHINKQDDYKTILEDNSITYPEFFDLVQLSSNLKEETFDYKSIKKGFKQNFEKWEPTKIHSLWTKKLIELNRPVLTTNYDYLLEFSDNRIKDFMKSKQRNKKLFKPLRLKKKGFTDVYPWHSYYSYKEIKNANNEFAIWHVHGFYEYPRSIRLGLSDYMKIVGKINIWLHKAAGNPFYKREELSKWTGANSWIDVFMNNHLLFVGISLDTNETALRWLLIEREKLFRMYPNLRKKTWYIVKEKLKPGKKLFFEKLNIEVIQASYTKIYKDIPKKIKI